MAVTEEDEEEVATGTIIMAAAVTSPVAIPMDEATAAATAAVQVTLTDLEEVVDIQMVLLVDMVEEEATAEVQAEIGCLTSEQVFRSNTGI